MVSRRHNRSSTLGRMINGQVADRRKRTSLILPPIPLWSPVFDFQVICFLTGNYCYNFNSGGMSSIGCTPAYGIEHENDTVSDPLKGVSTGSQKSSGSSSEGPSPTTPNSKVAEIDHQAANKTDAVDQPSSDIAVPSGGEKCPRPAMPNKPSSPASSITKPKRIAFYAWSAIGLWALIA